MFIVCPCCKRKVDSEDVKTLVGYISNGVIPEYKINIKVCTWCLGQWQEAANNPTIYFETHTSRIFDTLCGIDGPYKTDFEAFGNSYMEKATYPKSAIYVGDIFTAVAGMTPLEFDMLIGALTNERRKAHSMGVEASSDTPHDIGVGENLRDNQNNPTR